MKQYSEQIGDLLADESFLRWLSGSADEKESQRWQEWEAQSPENRHLIQEARILWQATQFQPTSVPDISQKLAQLEAALESEPPAEKAKTSISRIPFPIMGTIRTRKWMWAALGAAA
ncbi:MAG: hypothetical protein D6681_21760, partial [Calditrichaeota bacterium]